MIHHPTTDGDLLATFEVMQHLRPALVRETYVARIRALMASDGFRLTAAVEDGVVRAAAGWRVLDMLYCGRRLISNLLRERAHAFREGLAVDACG